MLKRIFRFTLQPARSGSLLFNVKCIIEHRKLPIYLKIQSCCMEIASKVCYFTKTGDEIYLEPEELNSIDLNEIALNREQFLKFVIKNCGKIGYIFKWVMQDINDGTYIVTVDNIEDYLPQNCTKDIMLRVVALKNANLINYSIKLEVRLHP